MNKKIAALFVRNDSIYKSLEDVDCWDLERNALNWPGGTPIIAHPPCRGWGMMRGLAKPIPGELDLARWAVAQVRRFGGVLEHPNRSLLWADQGLPEPGKVDSFGGWTLSVSQKWWGHKAEKLTLLYICGVGFNDIPVIPFDISYASHVVAQSNRNQKVRKRPEISKAEREHTPLEFALWLADIARKAKIFSDDTS